ncbi:MAG: hypothetical protein ACRD0U_10210, partial [Acidimicrobiales bacterium]
WMDEANGPVTITVSADGYVGATRGDVTIVAGGTTTEDFSLRLDQPCADVSPEAIGLTVIEGESATADLTLENLGAAPYDFTVSETPFVLNPVATSEPEFTEPATAGPQSVRSLPGAVAADAGSPNASPFAPPSWFGGADVPGGVVRYGHAQCDGDFNHFYVFSGVDSTFSVTDAAWRYDANTNTWNPLAPVPVGQEGPSAVCEAGQIHLLGGGGTNAHYVYDIGSDTWTTAAALPRNMWGAAVGAWNGKIYMAGGDSDFNFGGTSDEVNVYDMATDQWTTLARVMPHPAGAAGYVQAKQYLYVVGGWDDDSPAANVDVSQRLNLQTGAWSVGPAFSSARSDFALAATNKAIYAIGGDADGGGPFDASDTVERLATSGGGWRSGSWTAYDSLQLELSANSGGFCTNAIFGGEVWSVGGGNLNTSLGITGRTFFHGIRPERCASIRSDVPWLSEDPTSGTVAADSSSTVQVTVDAAELTTGQYAATLLINTTD